LAVHSLPDSVDIGGTCLPDRLSPHPEAGRVPPNGVGAVGK
jgi:hypothetical protein